MTRPRLLALVLAGGAGSRMGVLTDDRAKPTLPFGATHRLIDFPLTNCRMSGIGDVWVIEQHNPHSLIAHLANGRPWDLDRTLGGFRILHPFTDDDSEQWHEGNAHAIHAHADFIRECDPTHVLVLSADHVYTFDFRDLLDTHEASGVGLTVVTTEVDGDASRYGVVQVDGGKVKGFAYKPDEPTGSTVTTEVFLYGTATLLDGLDAVADEHGEEEMGDFGEHLLPTLVDAGEVGAHPLPGYWRDVGTIEAYWQGHADLLGAAPVLDLHDPSWPILGRLQYRPASRLLAGAVVEDAVVAPGAVVEGSVVRSVIGPGVHVGPGATIVDSVVMDDVTVEAGATVRRSIVADGARIDREADVGSELVSGDDGGITVVAAGARVPTGAAVTGEVSGRA